MKIKEGFILKKVMGSYMIVCTNPDITTNSMQTINETGAFLWNLLSKGATIESLTSDMTKEYEIDAETAKSDIEAFVAKLNEASLLDE